MKIGKKKTEVIAELFERFKIRDGFGVTAHKLDTIAQALSESLSNTKIRINIPYHSFNCHGTANKVAKDVIGVMPFSKNPININNVTTLYYGCKPITSQSYLPFLSEFDCFFIENIDMRGSSCITINLVKGPNWRMYL